MQQLESMFPLGDSKGTGQTHEWDTGRNRVSRNISIAAIGTYYGYQQVDVSRQHRPESWACSVTQSLFLRSGLDLW
jgi:hypothetical protein